MAASDDALQAVGSASRGADVGRMRIEKRNTIILEAAAVVTTAAAIVRTEQTEQTEQTV